MSEPASQPHPRDISEPLLTLALQSVAQPDLLRRLVEISRATFGFFPGQFNVAMAQANVVRPLDRLAEGARVLDIGAGLSPLPLMLAERGITVETIDNHPIERKLPSEPGWNEWGYFDYRSLHPRITSHHMDVTAFQPTEKFDAIVAVLSIAHMPRPVRERAITLAATWLKPGGEMLMSIDLVPNTDFIWNMSEGRQIAPPVEHGTIADLTNSFAAAGFEIAEARPIREMPTWTRTDLLFLRVVCNR